MHTDGTSRNRAPHFIAFTLIVLIGLAHAAWFIYSNARFPTAYIDIVYLSNYLHGFSESLFAGNAYPRWLGAVLGGAGAPVFVFYPPVAFYLGSLFLLPHSLDNWGIYQLGLAMSAGLILTSLMSYYWLCRHASAPVAAIIACTLLLIPSRFLMMHLQMGFAQLVVTAWFPLGLYCLERWREERDLRFLLGFSLVLALIALTHVPSMILFWPMLWLYGLFWQRPDWKTALSLSAAFIFALALAAVYLLPVWCNLGMIQSGGYTQYFSGYSTEEFFSPKETIQAAPYVIFAFAALWRCSKDTARDAMWPVISIFAVCIVLGSVLFFPLSISSYIWNHFFLFHVLQAPFRLLSLFFVLSIVLLLGIGKQLRLPYFILLIIVSLIAPTFFALHEYSISRDFSASASVQRGLQKKLAVHYLQDGNKTRWMPQGLTRADYYEAYNAIPAVAITQGLGNASVVLWKDENILLEVNTQTPCILTVKQHFFPGWQAFLGEAALPLTLDRSGFITFQLPQKTQGTILLSFSALPGAKAGDSISLCALAILLLAYGLTRTRKRTMPITD